MTIAANRRGVPNLLRRGALLVGLLALGGGFMIWMPGNNHRGPLPEPTAAEGLAARRLQDDVAMLAGSIGERNIHCYRQLQQAAAYIGDTLIRLGYQVREEPYQVAGRRVANIIAELPGTRRPEEIVVVGAHYDTVPGSPGADDNASGVAALLELARQFKGAKPGLTLRLAAFVNEEPPFFQSGLMGSRVHAARARQQGDQIVAMVSLEAIGIYADRPGSQLYPAFLGLFYPDTANFIAFVGNLGSRSLLRKAIGSFRAATPFPSEGVAAPGFVTGVEWSDHWAFWQEGYPAIMITDTALFRTPHYHESSDTPDRLDYGRMARVVAGIGRVVEGLVQ